MFARLPLVLLVLVTACGSDERTGVRLPEVILEDGFGLPCVDASTCPAACVPHAGDSVCTQACDPMRPCPTGWSCYAPQGDTGLCVSAFASLCRPCASDLDCAPVDLADKGLCVDYDGQGRFCGATCVDNTGCPADFTCKAIGDQKACVRDEGICPCTPYLEVLGAASPCATQNEYGTCPGEKTCGQGQWSECSAAIPAPDVLNGLDDDCDGETDEDGCLCGDGVCNAACAETLSTCPCDCAVEGDGLCSPCGESPVSAPIDCCRSPGGAGCGDGYCLGFGCGETPFSCAADCSTPCGNKVCEPGENPFNCAEDCQYKVCGNGICESSDGGPEGCPGDCAAFCGNCQCEPERNESLFNCPIDCGSCGDGVCSTCSTLREDRESCPVDCCEERPETCNGLDDDCDGETDEADSQGCRTFFRDDDRDGLGRWDDTRCLCAPGGPYRTPLLGDCDDTNPAVGQGDDEVCNERDDDCDGVTDEGFEVGAICDPGIACRTGLIVCSGPSSTACVAAGVAPADSRCSDASCEGNAVREASRCDDAGQCIPGALRACFGNLCLDKPEPRCTSACEDDGDCESPYHCAVTPTASLCAPDLALGQACGRDAQCAGGLCRDGVCCESECDGQCRSCALVVPGRCLFVSQGVDPDDDCGVCAACNGAGACTFRPAASDPDDDCDPRPPCGETGSCDGLGACAFFGDGITCGEGLCVGETALLPRRCTGDGTCAEPVLVGCQGFRCDTDGQGCADTCTTDNGCQADHFCDVAGACVPRSGNGVSCLRDGQCGSGRCVDGVCCESSCAGSCQRCDTAGAAGQCRPVSGEDGACTGQSTCVAGTCKRLPGQNCGLADQCASGRCVDGVCCESDCTGACETCVSGQCQPIVSAPSDTCTGESWCDAAGECGPIAGSACAGPCPRGHVCVAGVCMLPAPLGTPCTDDNACVSGQCTDGVCCESACLGQCRRCRADGRCEYLPIGSEEVGDCLASDETCGPGGVCVGTLGSVCGSGSDCVSGHCVDGVCCNEACDGTCESCMNGTCAGISGSPDLTCPAPSMCFGRDQCVGLEGTPCVVNGECVSGHCAFANGVGICCDSACEGACETCLGANPGQCEPVFSAENDGRCENPDWCDANAECGPIEGSSCNPDCPLGWVCLAGTCVRPAPDGTMCGSDQACVSGHCIDGVCCESRCDGICQRCDIIDGECLAAETGTDPDLECGVGICSREAGGCAGRPGEACGDDDECASGHCEGFTCCERECDGPCESCSTGECVPVDGDTASCMNELVCAAGLCLGDVGASCGNDNTCASGSCFSGTCCAHDCTDLCERCTSLGCERVAGAANPGRCEGAFVCNAESECVTRNPGCMLDEDCSIDQWCDAGACRDDGGLGASCEREAQCDSGVCSDGVCCASECEGMCVSCNVVGLEGLCSPIPFGGADPEAMCIDGACNGQGGCMRNPGAFCLDDRECRSGFCTDQVCCTSRCDDECESCAQTDTEGICTPLNAVEDAACNDVFICREGECRPRFGMPCTNGVCPEDLRCVNDHCVRDGPDATTCIDCDTTTCVGDTCTSPCIGDGCP